MSLTAFTELFLQVATHQAQPVTVDDRLVLCVNRGDGVLAVLNGGQRRLEANVFNTCGIGAPDRVVPVDLNLGVQTIVFEQYASGVVGVARVAHKLIGCGEQA